MVRNVAGCTYEETNGLTDFETLALIPNGCGNWGGGRAVDCGICGHGDGLCRGCVGLLACSANGGGEQLSERFQNLSRARTVRAPLSKACLWTTSAASVLACAGIAAAVPSEQKQALLSSVNALNSR